MANPGGTFPASDAEEEPNPGKNKQIEVDSESFQVVEIEELAEADKNHKEKKKDAIDRLKTTIVVSGIIAALAGAIFAITRKLKEK